jgi:hypothetical protein
MAIDAQFPAGEIGGANQRVLLQVITHAGKIDNWLDAVA